MHRRASAAAPMVAGLLLVGLGLATAQQAEKDEDQVKAVVTSVQENLAKGDVDAIGGLISESGFVAVISAENQTQCFDRDGFLAYLKGLVGRGVAGTVQFSDIEPKVHWTVGLVTAKINAGGDHLVLDATAMREAGKWKLAALLAPALRLLLNPASAPPPSSGSVTTIVTSVTSGLLLVTLIV
jgi:hypothetical protein